MATTYKKIKYNNNPVQVQSAIEDGTGNNIASTYATQASLSNYATTSDISAIEDLIPAEASSSNKLADKSFVNSSIATNTANFLGTYNIVTDLQLTTSATEQQIASAIATVLSGQTVTNNDYVFVAYPNATVTTEYDKFDRWKASVENNTTTWNYEYTLNNSSFTAEQWSAINSGITSTLVGKITTNENAIIALDTNKQNVINANNKLSYNYITDTPTIPTDTSDLTNNAGFITSSSLDSYLPLSAGSSKKLTGVLYVPSALQTSSENVWTNTKGVNFYDSSTIYGHIGVSDAGILGLEAKGNDGIYFGINGSTKAILNTTTFKPLSNEGLDLGGSSYKWNNIYGKTIYQNGKQVANAEDIPTNTSDLNNNSGFITGINSNDVTTALGYTPVNPSSLGTASSCNTGTSSGNVPILDSNGKLSTSVIPDAVIGQMEYKGTFNASTGSTLTGLEKGWYYICSTAGSKNPDGTSASSAYAVGDWAVYNGTSWDKIDNTDSVSSVNGKTGAVTLSASDVGALPDTTTIPTSINGLSGGSLTSPLVIKGGDATTASKIALDQSASGQITNNATQTIFGFTSNNATTLTVGHSSYALALRGSGTRPKFNSNDVAMSSDLGTQVTFSLSGTTLTITPK